MILRHFRNIFVTDFDDVSGSKDPSMSMLLIWSMITVKLQIQFQNIPEDLLKLACVCVCVCVCVCDIQNEWNSLHKIS
jgi:hypothetical protein